MNMFLKEIPPPAEEFSAKLADVVAEEIYDELALEMFDAELKVDAEDDENSLTSKKGNTC